MKGVELAGASFDVCLTVQVYDVGHEIKLIANIRGVSLSGASKVVGTGVLGASDLKELLVAVRGLDRTLGVIVLQLLETLAVLVSCGMVKRPKTPHLGVVARLDYLLACRAEVGRIVELRVCVPVDIGCVRLIELNGSSKHPRTLNLREIKLGLELSLLCST